MSSNSQHHPNAIEVSIVSGQYHFVDEAGWHLGWQTESAREWWKKQQWEKAGGHKQDGNEPQNS
jgi:hypothetical protein